MARMRTLKPEAATSESLADVDRSTRWTFALLWTHCDDEGRAVNNPKLIKAALYPLDDDVTAEVISAEIADLCRVGAVCVYEVDGREYLHVPAWHEHQHPNRKVDSKIPECPGGMGPTHVKQPRRDDSRTTHGGLTEHAVSPDPVLPTGNAVTPANTGLSEDAVSPHPQSTSVVVVGVVDGDVDGVGEGEANADAPRPPAAQSVNQRAQRLAKSYTDRVPLSRFPAIMSIAKKAIDAKYADDHIEQALLRLAAEGRSVTVETLRIELDGSPPPAKARKRDADDRVRDGLALAQRLAAESGPQQRQLGA